MFGHDFIAALAARSLAAATLSEVKGPGDGPFMEHPHTAADGTIAGTLRLWQGQGSSLIDRMVHFRLRSDPVDTQLFFLFGRADTAMPHFHGQVVQFAPDACVFNADFLSRLDIIDHPAYFTEVFAPLTKPYWKAINDTDNICALAPASPMIAAYLSPWTIGCGRPTNRAELERVGPQIEAFVDHYLDLAGNLKYSGAETAALADRDRRHLEQFFADELDPRAWKGVYDVIGEDAGRQVKAVFQTPLRAD